MIKKSGAGFKVVSEGNLGSSRTTSESGSKNLSKPNLTKEQAVKRLKQIEYFKTHKAGK